MKTMMISKLDLCGKRSSKSKKMFYSILNSSVISHFPLFLSVLAFVLHYICYFLSGLIILPYLDTGLLNMVENSSFLLPVPLFIFKLLQFQNQL